MSIVLIFVDRDGYVQERFFDLIHVANTSLTSKKEIPSVVSRHCLDIQNLHGQWYDGASNMCGEWNDLQALFLKDCHYAYHIHCLSHCLQIALIAVGREVSCVHQIFSNLTLIVNAPKSYRHLIEISLKFNLKPIVHVHCYLATEEGNYSSFGDANSTYDIITSFEFIFLLHLMRDILAITHGLCLALQCKNHDILNAMSLVFTTKSLIQKIRELGWKSFFKEKHEINVPKMTTLYLQELNSRFCDNMMELLTLSSTLNRKDLYKSLNVEKMCELTIKFNFDGFIKQVQLYYRIQIQHYELDKFINNLCAMSRIGETRKYLTYSLIDHLICLILAHPISIVPTKKSFLSMKIVKSRLRNKMEDGFLAKYLINYIERRNAEKFDTNSIIDNFMIRRNT
ncbi:Zinc finger MYM-type protein 1, partial [Mucuna pruriens]